MSLSSSTEDDAIITLTQRLEHRYAKNDIRDIYRIIHLLLEVLTEDEHYSHHYNKHTIIMGCLNRFYVHYPHSHIVIHSYSAYVSESLHKAKQDQNKLMYEKKRNSCRYCVIL